MKDTYDNHQQTTGGSIGQGEHDDVELREALREPLAGQSGDGLPLETVFDILRNERRQLVLGYLAVTDEDVLRTGELAEHVAAIENDCSVDALSSQQRKRVYVALYQCHLPKMADRNVIEFDKDRGTTRRASNLDQITPYLDVQGIDDSNPKSPSTGSLAVFAASCLLAYLLAASLASSGVLLGGAAITVGLLVGVGLESRDRDQ